MPKLKRLRLPITENDKRISGRKRYLVKHEGWQVCNAEKEWYGWNFPYPMSAGIQHDWIEKIYEVIGL